MTSGLLLIAEMLCKLPEGTTLRSYLFFYLFIYLFIYFLLLNEGVNQSIIYMSQGLSATQYLHCIFAYRCYFGGHVFSFLFKNGGIGECLFPISMYLVRPLVWLYKERKHNIAIYACKLLYSTP